MHFRLHAVIASKNSQSLRQIKSDKYSVLLCTKTLITGTSLYYSTKCLCQAFWVVVLWRTEWSVKWYSLSIVSPVSGHVTWKCLSGKESLNRHAVHFLNEPLSDSRWIGTCSTRTHTHTRIYTNQELSSGDFTCTWTHVIWCKSTPFISLNQ